MRSLDSGILLVTALTLVVGMLTFRDGLWQGDPRLSMLAASVWLLFPVAVVGKELFINEEIENLDWLIAGALAVVIVATRGRPALLMEGLWPDESQADEELNDVAFSRVWWTIGGICVLVLIAGIAGLA